MIGSFFSAGFSEVNRRFKLGGRRLSLWQLGLSAIFLSPAMFFVTWSTDPKFYLLAILNGVVMAFSSIRQLRLAADFNGRIASLFMPIKVIIAFLLWMMVSYTRSLPLFENTTQQWGVCLILVIMMSSFVYMVRSKVNLHIFKIIIPFSLMFALLDIAIKLVMEAGVSSALVFVFVATASGALSLLVHLSLRKKKKPFYAPELLKAGAALATCSLSGMVCFLLSLQMAENPAYPTVIILLSGVWLLLYYRMKNVEDNISPLTGTILVFCAIFLVVLTKL